MVLYIYLYGNIYVWEIELEQLIKIYILVKMLLNFNNFRKEGRKEGKEKEKKIIRVFR